jgi:hypothetical protein
MYKRTLEKKRETVFASHMKNLSEDSKWLFLAGLFTLFELGMQLVM